MEKFSIEVIKHLILIKEMKQYEIVKGICAPSHFSKILSGKRKMTPEIFEQVMIKLGQNPRDYIGVSTAEDTQAILLRNELKYLLRHNNEECIKKSEEIIEKIERAHHFSHGVGLQILLGHKASLALYKEEYEEMLNYCKNGLEVTRPKCVHSCEAGFDEEKIETYSLSTEEVKLIIQLSIARANIKSSNVSPKSPLEISAKILIKLNDSLNKNPYHDEERANIHITMLYNLTKNLGLLKKLNETIKLCDEGIEYCKKYRNSFFEPLFMFNKAYVLLLAGNKKDGESLLQKTCAILYATDRHDELEMVKQSIVDEFGITI